MFLRKISFKGIKGVRENIDIDFTPSSLTSYKGNIETFGLKRNQSDFHASKQIVLVGSNSSGKTSILTGIALGIKLLSFPDKYRGLVRDRKNIFSDDEISFKYEIVTKISQKISETEVVRKYIIEYAYNSATHQFTSERIDFVSASETSSKEIKNLYKYENGALSIFGKEISQLSFGGFSSIFSQMISGAINFNFVAGESFNFDEHIAALRKISIYPDKLGNTARVEDLSTLKIPRVSRGTEALISMAKIIDKNIVGVKFEENKPFFDYQDASTGKIYTIPFKSFAELISAGALELFSTFDLIWKALEAEEELVIFDEFATSWHDGLIKVMFEVLRRSKGQVILSTHNTTIFDQQIRLDQIFNVKMTDKINVERLDDDSFDLEMRNANRNTITRQLQNEPNLDAAMELIKILDEK